MELTVSQRIQDADVDVGRRADGAQLTDCQELPVGDAGGHVVDTFLHGNVVHLTHSALNVLSQ